MHVEVKVESKQSIEGKQVLGALCKALENLYRVDFLGQETKITRSGAEAVIGWELSDKVEYSAQTGKTERLSVEVDTSGIQQVLEGFAIDPLESAIRDTVSLIGDEHERLSAAGKDASNVLIHLDDHLKALLAIQLARLSQVSVATDESSDQYMAQNWPANPKA